MKFSIIVATGMLWVGSVLNAAPTDTTPQLTADVKLELVSDQRDIYKTALQLQQLQAQLNSQQARFNGHLTTALERSKIDAKAYMVNHDTFEVSRVPVTPTPASK